MKCIDNCPPIQLLVNESGGIGETRRCLVHHRVLTPSRGRARLTAEEYFFLKTIIPSRKATRDYLNPGDADVEN